jgi:hypothetical protein
VFAIDESTDQTFMRATMQQAWRQIKERSPNRQIEAGGVSLVQLSSDGAKRDLLYALCAAASTKAA